jgi:hypothetical protein
MRWPILATFGVFTMSLLLAAWLEGVRPLGVVALVANMTVLVLVALPSTRRDVGWAEMAEERPDYVAERLGNTER